MSSGTIIQFKHPEITDSLVEDFDSKRRTPKKPIKFFGITESNPVKFIEISEIEVDCPPEKIVNQSYPEEKPDLNFPPKEEVQIPQVADISEEKTSDITEVETSSNTTQEKISNIAEKLISDIVEENISNIEIETAHFFQVENIAEETSSTITEETSSNTTEESASTIDIENIEASDELPKYGISPSVMVIEDDRVISSFLQHLLKRRGFLTHYAADGLKAVEMFEEIPPPNLIIVDLMLPFLDGFELIKKIRNKDEWANIPIIVVTSKTQEQDLTRAFETGANDYLVKPFRSQELIARVKRFVPQK